MTRPDGDAEDPLHPAALGVLLPLLSGYAWSWLLYVAAALDLADHLAEGPRSAAELAKRCEADPSALQRVLEALAALGVVMRLGDGRFAPTPVSDWLRRDVPGSQRPLALMLADPRIQRTWADTLAAVKSGEVAFERVNGMPFFDLLDRAPDLAALFHAAGGGTRTWNRDIARALDLSECRAVVDVGGGDGSLMTAITAMHPHVEGIVLERPSVIETMAASPIAGAWRWQAGDFLDAVPAGADAYVLRRILHDWDDERAARILANIRRAMPAGARLFIFEFVVQPEARGATALLDFTLFVLTGGRERDEAGYRALLASADLEIDRTWRTTAGIDLIVARPAGWRQA